MSPISPQALRQLLEKYDLLLGLHAGEPGRTIARRDALRVVAERFPGALREWDQLSKAALEQRRARVAQLLSAVETGEPLRVEIEPWLRYCAELHVELRALLRERSRRPTERGRRLSESAYAEIAARHGVSVAAVKQAIFVDEDADVDAGA